jgi:hypothetical protein
MKIEKKKKKRIPIYISDYLLEVIIGLWQFGIFIN